MKRRAPLSDGQRSLRDFFSPPAKKGPPSKELPTPSSSVVVVVDEQIDRTPSSPATAPSNIQKTVQETRRRLAVHRQVEAVFIRRTSDALSIACL